MGLKIKASDSERELAPEGTHTAVCVRILDLGTQTHEQYGEKRKLNLAFELLEEQTETGEPFVVYKTYTASMSQRASLGKDVRSWMNVKIERDEEFDLDTLLGKPAMITIVRTEGSDNKVYANIETITGLPKGMKVAKPSTELQTLYLDESFDQEVFDSLPEFLQDKIKLSPEFDEVGSSQPKPKAKAKPEPKAKPATKKRK
jgi:hypothetical protein